MNLLTIWKEVFSKKKYVLYAVMIAIVFYLVNFLISSWKGLTGFYSSLGFFGSIKFFFTLLFVFGKTIKIHSFISLILISILFGILFSLIFYKVKTNKPLDRKTGFIGGLGIFLAMLVPGCAACGVGLISTLGISAGILTFLPFDGLEFSILSILILGFAIVKISNGMYKCDIPLGKIELKENQRFSNNSVHKFTELKKEV